MVYSYTLKKTFRQSYLALWSKRFSLFACFIAAFGIYMSRKSIIPQNQAITVMGLALFLSFIAIICAVTSFFDIWKTGAHGLKSAYVGFFTSLTLLAYPAYLLAIAYTLPMLNDVTSDFNNPPQLNNETVYNSDFAILQREAYSDIQPIILEMNPQESQTLILEVLKTMNLYIKQGMEPESLINTKSRMDELTINAMAYSFIMKLPETITIRLRSVGSKIQPETRIDMRSKSHFGRHDFGSNAQRLTKIIENISEMSKQR